MTTIMIIACAIVCSLERLSKKEKASVCALMLLVGIAPVVVDSAFASMSVTELPRVAIETFANLVTSR